jgi:3'-5' exoribonuclease
VKKQIFVKDINRENIDVNDRFIVIKKDIFSSKNNTKYMSLRLKDRTGIIEGRVWERVDELNGLFEKNDIVNVQSRSRLYQERFQLNITDVRKVEGEISLEDMKEFFPENESGNEKLKEEYFKLVSEIKNPHIVSLFTSFHGRKDMLERFFLFPASIGVHHMYIGGLLEHSLSMAKMGKLVVDIVGGDKDVIIAGSLLHDIGKIDEINIKGGFKYSDKGRLLGHIALGIVTLKGLIEKVDGFPDHIADVLAHIIISHHGVEEWGSPKKPMCIEALMVHYLDNLDAKIMGVKEHMKENMEDEKWTEYHRLYESRFYKLPER